jgi:hypothetical protein
MIEDENKRRDLMRELFDAMGGDPGFRQEVAMAALSSAESESSAAGLLYRRLFSVLLSVVCSSPRPAKGMYMGFSCADVVELLDKEYRGAPIMDELRACLLGQGEAERAKGPPATIDDLVAMAEAGLLHGVAVRFPLEDGPEHALALRDWPSAMGWFEDVAHHLMDPESNARPTVTGTWSANWRGGAATACPIEFDLSDMERLFAAATKGACK